MQSSTLSRQSKRAWVWDLPTTANISVYGLMYAGLVLLAYFLPTGDFLLRPGAALLLAVGAAYGPVVGFGTGLLGGLIADLAQDMLWIHWDLGLGVMGAIFGLFTFWKKESDSAVVTWAKMAILAVVGSFCGMFLAGLVDLLLGAPAVIAFYAWALPSALLNALFAVAIGPLIYLFFTGKFCNVKRRNYTRA